MPAPRRVQLESFGDQRGVLLPRGVMEVLHCRLDVGVAHPLLDPADVCLGDHAGAEGVAEIVEAELAEVSALEGRVVAAA